MNEILRRTPHTLAIASLIAALSGAPIFGQTPASMISDEEGIIQAALDYMEGALNADAERVGRGVHPELTKVIVRTLPQTGTQILSYSGYTMLVEIVRGLADQLANVDKTVDVTVFDIGHDIAMARAVGQVWYDYLQLAKIDGEWKIVNVLWAQNQPGAAASNSEADRPLIQEAALDYIEGAYSGDAERMARAIHPELTKVLLTQNRKTGRPFLYRIGASSLIEGTAAGLGVLGEDERDIDVEIFDVSHDMAVAKVTSAKYIDLLQLARFDGDWKIINVLWVPNPDDSATSD